MLETTCWMTSQPTGLSDKNVMKFNSSLGDILQLPIWQFDIYCHMALEQMKKNDN